MPRIFAVAKLLAGRPRDRYPELAPTGPARIDAAQRVPPETQGMVAELGIKSIKPTQRWIPSIAVPLPVLDLRI